MSGHEPDGRSGHDEVEGVDLHAKGAPLDPDRMDVTRVPLAASRAAARHRQQRAERDTADVA